MEIVCKLVGISLRAYIFSASPQYDLCPFCVSLLVTVSKDCANKGPILCLLLYSMAVLVSLCICYWLYRDGIGWGEMRWDGMKGDGMGWDVMKCDGMGWYGIGWDEMQWDGMGWDGIKCDGMG